VAGWDPVWGAEALPLLEQAIEQAIATKFMGLQARRVAWSSEAYLLTGRRDEALRLAQRALELAGLHKERGHETWALRLLGEIASQGSPPEVESATASYRQAMALAEEFGMHPLLAHCHLGGGMLYARIDHREGARTHLSKALALYCTLEMTFWLPQVEGVLVQMEKR
jgi:tetratricopeptide (TPR) repeat protein